MPGLIKHISIILILFTVLTLILDVIFQKAYQSSVPRNKVQLVANLSDTHIDYIFLGSSRTENHIDCEQVEKLTGKSCINLGLQAGRIKDYRILVDIIQRNRVTYNNLFIQLDYSYNFDDYSKGFLAQLMPFINQANFPRSSYENLEIPYYYRLPYLRFASNEKKIGFRETLLQWLQKSVKGNLQNGFVPLEGSGTNISGHFPKEIAPSNQALQDIIESVETNRLVLFTSPYCKNGENRDVFIQELKARFSSLQDYSALFDKNEKYFVNCGHLNKEGAERFTKILTQEILLD